MCTNDSTQTATRVTPRTGDIIVGVDDSPSAAAALRWAAQQSRLTGRPVRVVHAWQLKAAEAASARAVDFAEAASADARANATRWVMNALGHEATGLHWRLEVVEGPPGPVLIARARNACLLVLGTQEHTGVRRAVLGSVSHYCLSRAEPPVVAVPTPAKPTRDASPTGEATTTRDLMTTPGPLL